MCHPWNVSKLWHFRKEKNRKPWAELKTNSCPQAQPEVVLGGEPSATEAAPQLQTSMGPLDKLFNQPSAFWMSVHVCPDQNPSSKAELRESSSELVVLKHQVQISDEEHDWLVVWNMTFISPFSWEFHHLNWRTHFFSRGVVTNHQPDEVCVNVGFRSIEIRQGRLLLNGRCLTADGIATGSDKWREQFGARGSNYSAFPREAKSYNQSFPNSTCSTYIYIYIYIYTDAFIYSFTYSNCNSNYRK